MPITTDIPDDNGAVHADLVIFGDSDQPVVTTAVESNQTVVYRRSFKEGVTATVILPFSFTASDYFKNKGSFHTIDQVFYDNKTSQWVAKTSDDIDEIEANKPYIFKPSADFYLVAFKGVDIQKTKDGLTKAATEDDATSFETETNAKDWTLVGVYTKKTWSQRTANEYGFAAKQISYTDNETQVKVNITAGEFVRAGENATIKPTRAYLRYTGTDATLNPGIQTKSAAELPDRIVLVFPGETASVIDPSDDPTDNGNISTPISELTPAANVKVWSHDKTIYISAQPGTDYRIIDLGGRTLRTATTLSDRDEIRLGIHTGIVIVIINGQSYKIMY
jgi:hypothetical protein